MIDLIMSDQIGSPRAHNIQKMITYNLIASTFQHFYYSIEIVIDKLYWDIHYKIDW